LTKKEVLENAKTYKEQASRILRFDGPNPVEIKYNSEWLATMSAIEFFRLAHFLTYSQIIERDMFQERMKKGQDLFMNEFLYPFMQGYDSVAMDVDLEIGGSDQMFNMLMGRKLMHKILKKEKFVMTVPLLTDSNGVKLGKTEGNAIGITDPAKEFFSKIMALGDNAIIPCFTLLTDIPLDKIHSMEQDMKQGKNPMAFKKQLAFELTKQFNDEKQAEQAKNEFEIRFQKGDLTQSDLPTKSVSEFPEGSTILDALVLASIAESNSSARRLVEQHAVKINNTLIGSPKEVVHIKKDDILQAGKKAVKIVK